MDPTRTTVMYAPTWTRFSSLNAMGEAVIAGLVRAGYRVLVKLHENSLDPAVVNSGGVDWVSRLTPILAKGDGHLLRSSDATTWLAAADLLITDHSSIGFEYLLLDRPLIRISMPELISGAQVAREYVDLVATAATTAETAGGVIAAVEQALSQPTERSESRRTLAAELFHDPGHATDRAVTALYELIELDAPRPVSAAVRPTNPHLDQVLAR
jgi:CDP-glycerol glycerophosphotransferase (TagB/SpsB family)